MKHIIFFSLTTLFPISIANGMNSKLDPQKSNNILFFQLKKSFPRVLAPHLPSETNALICDMLIFQTPTLNESARTINRLSSTCKSFNKIMNKNISSLIKFLPQIYRNCSNEHAANALQLKKASKILFKQLAFAKLCELDGSFLSLSHIEKNNVDLNFTYGRDGETQLMRACTISFHATQTIPQSHLTLIEWLIKNGADINIADNSGTTAPFYAITPWNANGKQLIEYFWDLPSFKINAIKWHGFKKTLLFAFIYEHWHMRNVNIDAGCIHKATDPHRAEKLAIVQKLCDRGADPEVVHVYKSPGRMNHTPLSVAKECNDKKLVKILKRAIKKKHANKDK